MIGMKAASELWVRPHPWTSLAQLRELIQNRLLRATPRLGIRDQSHPKGYLLGQPADLKLFNADGTPMLITPVEIVDLLVKPLAKLSAADLRGCGPSCLNWRDVHKLLSFFEKRELNPRERVTVVRFAYRKE